MNNQAFPQLSHFIKVALFGIVIEKKYMQHTLECVSLTGQKGYFGFPSAKLGPPFMAQSIFYFIYFAISPAPCCVYFLKNGQMQHFSCRTFTAVVSQKTNKCTTNVHHPVRIFVTDCAAKQKLCLSLCKKTARNEKYQVLSNNEVDRSRHWHRGGGSFNLSQEGTLLFCAIVLSKFSQVGS